MTTGACGKSIRGIAATVKLASLCYERCILGGHLFGCQRIVVRRQIAHVVSRKTCRYGRHNWIIAHPGLEFAQLLQKIVRLLTGDTGVRGKRAVAVKSVASGTDLVSNTLCFR